MSAYDKYLDLLEFYETDNFEDAYFETKKQVCHLFASSNHMQTYKILQHTLNLDDYHPYKKWILSTLPEAYQKHPSLRQKVIKTLNDSYFDKHLDVFYQTAVQTALIAKNTDDRQLCLDKINLRIRDKQNSPHTLKTAFRELGRLMKSDIESKPYVAGIIKYGMDNPQNDEESFLEAEYILDSKGTLNSNAFICKRVPKTPSDPYGIKRVGQPDLERPCVFVLPGGATVAEKELNGYLSDIESLLTKNNLGQKADVYGCFYDFGEYMNRAVAINNQMKKYHRLRAHDINMEEENISPQYAEILFEKLLLPRIADKNGKRRNLNDAQKYIRNINFFAHCHGGYAFLKLEEKLQEKMTALGYTDAERKQIFDNLLCVAFAPFAPVGVSKSQMISFMSADDDIVRQHNLADFHIRKMAQKGDFKPSYFPGKQGNCFIVSKISEKSNGHNFFGFSDKRTDFTDDGVMLTNLMSSALVEGVRSSVTNQKLPHIQKLTDKKAHTFNLFAQNGRLMWQKITEKSKESVMERKILKAICRSDVFGIYE